MKNNLLFDTLSNNDILLHNDKTALYIPNKIVLTDAFMRDILQPKEQMTKATDYCFLSLLSWRITNVLLKNTFEQLKVQKYEIAYSVIFSSIAGKRIMTFDPSFISNAILEEPQNGKKENMVYTQTLRGYIEEDIFEFFHKHLDPLSNRQKRKMVKYVFGKYQDTIKSCVEKISGVTYCPKKLLP